MAENRKTKTVHDAEFKMSAAKLVLEEGMTRVKVSQDLGVSQVLVGKWVKEFAAQGADAFPGSGYLSAKDQKIKDLESECRQLKMERDILKKATAFFASHGR